MKPSVSATDHVYGTSLFKKIERVISELESTPDSAQKSEEIAKLEHLTKIIAYKTASSANGFAYLAFSFMEQNGKLEFLDRTEGDRFREVFLLIDKYGLPEAFNCALTDEVVIELVEAAMRDGEVWNYTKRLCANELQSDRELHPLLLKFVGYALVIPPTKRKAGRPALKYTARNEFFSLVATHLQSSFNLPFSRGIGSQSDSACSVISDTMSAFGLHMTEEAIRKAIEKHKADMIDKVKNSEKIVSGD